MDKSEEDMDEEGRIEDGGEGGVGREKGIVLLEDEDKERVISEEAVW